jgi:Zn-dependent protease with chaperone function
MDSVLEYKVNTKENFYFYLRLILSLGLYYLIVKLILLSFTSVNPAKSTFYLLYLYFALIIIYLLFRFGVLIGHLKGNAIKLSKKQFPDIYQIVLNQSGLLGLKTIPDVYILQSGGVLNAFAAKFLGRNYIVLYSEIVESAYEQDKKILEFIIGHELGHIKRNHMFKNLLLIPSYIIPFLGSAYSRACEYTCDNIGNSLCPSGVKSGLLLLASGKKIYKNVNIKEFLIQDYSEDGFWKWFSEKVSSHPNLTKRLACFVNVKEATSFAGSTSLSEKFVESTLLIEKKEEDLSRFMPK